MILENLIFYSFSAIVKIIIDIMIDEKLIIIALEN